ncbi:MAG: Crp/Fnr family transcriptional regulator [Rudaea sp.]
MLTEKQLADLYQLYPILRDLSRGLREKLRLEARQIQMRPNEALFDPTSDCDSYIMITSGSLRVVEFGKAGQELTLYHVRPGQACVLTASCILENASYCASGIAESEVDAVCLPRGLFLELLDRSRPFRLYVLHSFAQGTIQLSGVAEAVAFGSLPQRLASSLLSRGNPISTTHQMLADELGTTREAVSRALESMERQGLLALARGRITIRDRRALAEITGRQR